jgi:GTPase SAR1 family protein
LPAIFAIRSVLIGESGVGQTSILSRCTEGKFDPNERPTIGRASFDWSGTISGLAGTIEIWGTAGQDQYRSLCPSYYRNALGAVVVGDLRDDEFAIESKPLQCRNALNSITNSFAEVGNGRERANE